MTDDNLRPFCFPVVHRKKITAAFDGGRISSDGGVMLLAQAERRLGIADQLARVIPDERDASRVTHLLPDILRARIFAIACGYEDAYDLDWLRFDPAFKLACGRLPDTGEDLCSQPTVSRWENAPGLRDLIRLMGVMVDLYCTSYTKPPKAVTLDIDDTVDVVHGHQQLSLFNAHYDERCLLPIHVYDTATSRPVAVLLRPARNSSFTYKGQAVDVKQVGRELGVHYVLEGSVRKAGNRVRITGQLIDAATGAHLWADRFDGSFEDVFELQDKVASSIAGVNRPCRPPRPPVPPPDRPPT